MAYSGSSITIKQREKNEKQEKLNKYGAEELKCYIRRQKEIRRLREMQEFEERERELESKKQRLKELDMKCKQIAYKKQEKRIEGRASYQVSSSSQRNSERNQDLKTVDGNFVQNGTSRHVPKDREEFEERLRGFDKIPNLTVKRRPSSKGLVEVKQSKSACRMEREAANFIFKEFENIVRRECKNLLRTRSAQFYSRSVSSTSIQSEVKEEDGIDGRQRVSRSKPEKVRKEDKNVGTSFIIYDYLDTRSDNDIAAQKKNSLNGNDEGRCVSYMSVSDGERSGGKGYRKLLHRTSEHDLSPYFTTNIRQLNKISERTKNEAAAKIQAAYKSYRVRKVLSEAKLRPGRSRKNGHAMKDLGTANSILYPAPPVQGKQFAEASRRKLFRGGDIVGHEKINVNNNSPPQRPEKPYDERMRSKLSRTSTRSCKDSVKQSSTPLKTNLEGIPGYIPPPPEIGLLPRPTSASPRMLPFLRFKQVDEPFPKHVHGRIHGMQRSDLVQSTQSPLKMISSISKFQLPYSLKSSHSKEGKSPKVDENNMRARIASRVSSEASPSSSRTPMQSQAQAYKETLIQLRSVREKSVGSPQRGVASSRQHPNTYNPILDLPDPAFSMVLQEKLRLMKEQMDPRPTSLFAPPSIPSPVRKSQMTAVSKATEQIKRKIIEAKHILEEYKNELLRCNNNTNTSIVSHRDDLTYESDFDTDIPSQSASMSHQLTGGTIESDVTSRGREILVTSNTVKSPRKPQVAVRPTTSHSSLETLKSSTKRPPIMIEKSATSPTGEPVSISASLTKSSAVKESCRNMMTTSNSRHSPQGSKPVGDGNDGRLPDGVKTPLQRVVQSTPEKMSHMPSKETAEVFKAETHTETVGKEVPREKSPVSTIDRTEDGVEDVDEDAEESLSTSSKNIEDESDTDYEEIPPTASRGSLNLATEDVNYDTDFDSDIQSLSLSKPHLSTATQKGEPVSSIAEDDEDEEVEEDFEGESEQASSSVVYDTKKPAAVQRLSSIEENLSKETIDQSSQVAPDEISEYESEVLPKFVNSTSLLAGSAANKLLQLELLDSSQVLDEHISYDTEFDTDIQSSSKQQQPSASRKKSLQESGTIAVEIEDSAKDSTIKEDIDDLSVEQSIAYDISESPKPVIPKIANLLHPKPVLSAAQPPKTELSKSGPTNEGKFVKKVKPIDLNLSNASDSSAVSDISTPKDIDDILEKILAEDSSDMEEMGDKVLDSGTSEDKYTLETEKPRDSFQDGLDISPQVDIGQLDGLGNKNMTSSFLETLPPIISSVSEVTEQEDDWTGKQSITETGTGKSIVDTSWLLQKHELEEQKLSGVSGGGDQDENSDEDNFVEEFLSLKTVPKVQELQTSIISEPPAKKLDLDKPKNVEFQKALIAPDVISPETNIEMESPRKIGPNQDLSVDELCEEVSQSSQVSASVSSQILEAVPSRISEVAEAPQSMPAKTFDSKEILEIAKSVDACIVEKIESLIAEEISKQIDSEHEDYSQGTGIDDSNYSLNSPASNFYVEEVIYESDFDTEAHSERSEASKNKSSSASLSSSKHHARSKLENVVKEEVQRFVEGERVIVDQEINERVEKSAEDSEKENSISAHNTASCRKPPVATLESRLANVIEKKEVMNALVSRILKRVFKDVVSDDKHAATDVEEMKSKFATSMFNEIECLSPIPKPSSDDEIEDSIQEELDGGVEWFEDELIPPNHDAEEESLKLEAAKIVAEQLRIEKEIRALEALQAQVPANLLGLADVPDKPPPPYSPPSSESVSFTSRTFAIQCTTKELENKIALVVDSIWDSWKSTGLFVVLEEPELVELKSGSGTTPPCRGDASGVTEDTVENKSQVNSSTEHVNNNSNQLSPSTISARAFNTLLHDLIVDTIKEILLIENVDSSCAKPYVDRVRPGYLALEAAKLRIPRTKEALIQTAFSRITNLLPYPVLASYVPTPRKRLTKWTSRPRDPVDEVLAEELIDEDREWTESWPEEILVLDRWTEKFSRRALHEVMLACKAVVS